MIYLPYLFGKQSPLHLFLRFCSVSCRASRAIILPSLSLFPFFNLIAQSDIASLSDKEIAKRQSGAKQSTELTIKAKRAWNDASLDKKNLEIAYNDYIAALDSLPPSSATADQRKLVLDSFCNVAMEYANYLIDRGRFADAENVAKTILSAPYSPNYKPAAQLLSNLEQPGYYNRTITPGFAEKKDKISLILNQAEGYLATGRYDLALKRYEEALNLDPYNVAARQGMENLNKQRTNYYDEAYNETRSRMLWLADRSWERPVRKVRSLDRSTEGGPQDKSSNKEAINRKLNGTIIEKIELPEASIREVVDYLKQKSRELDTSTDDPKKRGVNIVLKLPTAQPATSSASDATTTTTDQPANPAVTENFKVSLALRNVPLIEAIRYLTELSGLKYKIEPYAVLLVPITENTDELLTKEYRVKPNFIPSDTGSTESAPVAGNQAAGGNKDRIKGQKNATSYLKDQGIPFPKNSFAQYIPSGNKLIVRNTQNALDLIGVLVDGDMGAAPTQVEIESKFVEITQNNVSELGFDWLLGPLSIGGGVYGNGGSRTAGQPLTGDYYNNFPFADVGQNPVTAGNRNGIGTGANSAITANSLNALLAGIPQGANVASPGILGLAGVFTNPQFQLVIRALNQKKGVDLMSAPKVTTKSGVKATIKIVREFPYPTDFTPATVPPSAGNQGQNGQNGQNFGHPIPAPSPGEKLILQQNPLIVTTSAAVTPTTPTTFANRDIGVTLEVEPQVGADNYTIDLSLSPQVVEFEGFINYGSPVIGPKYVTPTLLNPSGIQTFTITDNVINQPIFGVRKVNTSVSIWDGQTVALGGLIREDVQKVADKVPFLGDIPLAGRLFRSNVDQKIKRNLIIFVTARLMDAQGQPLKQDNEDEDIVNPVGLPEDLPPPIINTRSTGK
ncbi:MAG: Amuc_1098 family type IV pilus outer membrane protein [bacterium]